MFRITFVRYAQNNLHQVRSKATDWKDKHFKICLLERCHWAWSMGRCFSTRKNGDGKYDWKKCTLVQATNERPLQTSCCSLEAAASCLLRVRYVTFIYISLKLASEKLGIICIPPGFFHGTHFGNL